MTAKGPTPRDFSARVRSEMQALGLSQRKLARNGGFSAGTVRNWLDGTNRPRGTLAGQLATALGGPLGALSIDWLLDGVGEKYRGPRAHLDRLGQELWTDAQRAWPPVVPLYVAGRPVRQILRRDFLPAPDRIPDLVTASLRRDAEREWIAAIHSERASLLEWIDRVAAPLLQGQQHALRQLQTQVASLPDEAFAEGVDLDDVPDSVVRLKWPDIVRRVRRRRLGPEIKPLGVPPIVTGEGYRVLLQATQNDEDTERPRPASVRAWLRVWAPRGPDPGPLLTPEEIAFAGYNVQGWEQVVEDQPFEPWPDVKGRYVGCLAPAITVKLEPWAEGWLLVEAFALGDRTPRWVGEVPVLRGLSGGTSAAIRTGRSTVATVVTRRSVHAGASRHRSKANR